MYTIDYVAIRPGVHVVLSETCESPRLSEARDRADKKLEQLRQDHPHFEIDGYRVTDRSGTVVLRSWET